MPAPISLPKGLWLWQGPALQEEPILPRCLPLSRGHGKVTPCPSYQVGSQEKAGSHLRRGRGVMPVLVCPWHFKDALKMPFFCFIWAKPLNNPFCPHIAQLHTHPTPAKPLQSPQKQRDPVQSQQGKGFQDLPSNPAHIESGHHTLPLPAGWQTAARISGSFVIFKRHKREQKAEIRVQHTQI